MNEAVSSLTRISGEFGHPITRAMCVFGTRPEVIKFLPVLRELRRRKNYLPISVLTSQHTTLLAPLLKSWEVSVDYDLQVMRPGQSLNELMSRIQVGMDGILDREAPDLVLVQGDTTTALSAALAAWHRGIPVGHIEAGLRSGKRESPFPEEMNRRLITGIATLHFAPTAGNAAALRGEGVPEERIIQCGNPIVDAIQLILRTQGPSPEIRDLIAGMAGQRLVVLTTHRRESFGATMRNRLRELRQFLSKNDDVNLVFPVHANPAVMEAATAELGGLPRVHLTEPMTYSDFLYCLSNAWLIVSDSGGVQEEAPSLGKPLLVIRDNTERPEVVECGVARLVGDEPGRLRRELETASRAGSWASRVTPMANPFGKGDSARRIVDSIAAWRAEAARMITEYRE